MRIAVLGTSRAGTDPVTVRLVLSLADTGHDVSFVTTGGVDERIDDAASQVVVVGTRWPSHRGRVGAFIRRRNPASFRHRIGRKNIVSALRSIRPDLVYAVNTDLARLADEQGYVVASDRMMPIEIANDLVRLAPTHPSLGGLAEGSGGDWLDRSATSPAAGRHVGKRVVLCYHPTETTPARYLHAALERAGMHVDHRYPTVNLSEIPDETDAVIFVESPYPALSVDGETTVPVLYWVHHGEIHLYQNLRLAKRYRADAVLLAHSWHLAHRFDAPVFMFPFGVPTELLAEDVPFSERTIEVSMIAAGFDGTDERYAARRHAAKALTAEFGEDRVRFAGGIHPSEVFSTYAQSKVVIDDGGTRHRPITMRVFEATGSGAALVTEPAAGIELLFEQGTEFVPAKLASSRDSVTGEERNSEIANAGRRRALGVHTYDHRVDELVSIAESLGRRSGHVITSVSSHFDCEPAPESGSPLLEVLNGFPEIDSIACSEASMVDLGRSDYVVRNHRDVVSKGIAVDAVIFADRDVPIAGLLSCAHRYALCTAPVASTVRSMIESARRSATESLYGDVHVFDFATPGYIVRDCA